MRGSRLYSRSDDVALLAVPALPPVDVVVDDPDPGGDIRLSRPSMTFNCVKMASDRALFSLNLANIISMLRSRLSTRRNFESMADRVISNRLYTYGSLQKVKKKKKLVLLAREIQNYKWEIASGIEIRRKR